MMQLQRVVIHLLNEFAITSVILLIYYDATYGEMTDMLLIFDY